MAGAADSEMAFEFQAGAKGQLEQSVHYVVSAGRGRNAATPENECDEPGIDRPVSKAPVVSNKGRPPEEEPTPRGAEQRQPGSAATSSPGPN